MTSLGRVSQLKLSLIFSRLRREIMRGSSAASSSSCSCSSSEEKYSLAKLFTLQTHFSQLDERRRNAASLRLFDRMDDAVTFAASDDDHLGDAAFENARRRRGQMSDDEFPSYASSPKRADFMEGVAFDLGVTDGHDPSYAGGKDRMFRQNVSEFVEVLEGVFDEVKGNSAAPVCRKRSWTTDDIIQRANDETVKERLSLDAIFRDETVNYYQLLDKYVAHNVQRKELPKLNFLLEKKLEVASGDASSARDSNAFLTETHCPYYLSAMEEENATHDFATTTPREKRPTDGPSKEQLLDVFNSLSSGLPRLLAQNLDYSMFADDVVFVNNWHGNATTSIGLKSLKSRMALLRAICNILFVRAEMQLLKIMLFEEESCVRARWRIEGAGILHKFTTTTTSFAKGGNRQWYDGIATFYVNNRGKIARVEVERLLPDKENVKNKPNPVSFALTALIGGGCISDAPYGVAVTPSLLATATAEGKSDREA